MNGIDSASAVGSATVTKTYDGLADGTIEQHVGVLDGRTRELRDDLNQMVGQISAVDQASHQRDETETTERKRTDEDLNKSLEDLATGGLRLESGGLALLTIGIILATIPEEVSRLW